MHIYNGHNCIRARHPPPGPGGLPRPLMSARALCAHTDNASPAGAHPQPPMCQGNLFTSFRCQKSRHCTAAFRALGQDGIQALDRGPPCPDLPPAAGSTLCVGDAGTRLWFKTAPPRISPLAPQVRAGGKARELGYLEPKNDIRKLYVMVTTVLTVLSLSSHDSAIIETPTSSCSTPLPALAGQGRVPRTLA